MKFEIYYFLIEIVCGHIASQTPDLIIIIDKKTNKQTPFDNCRLAPGPPPAPCLNNRNVLETKQKKLLNEAD